MPELYYYLTDRPILFNYKKLNTLFNYIIYPKHIYKLSKYLSN